MADRIIKSGLRVAGRQYQVEAFVEVRPDSICGACSGWGHGEHNCSFPDMARCSLCAGLHRTADHKCSIKDCKASRGLVCTHLIAKCANCKGPHSARSDQCPKKKEALEQAKGWRGKASMVQPAAPTPIPENQRTRAVLEVAEALQDIMERDDGLYASKHAVQDRGARTIPDSQPFQDSPPSTVEREAMERGLSLIRRREQSNELRTKIFGQPPLKDSEPLCNSCNDQGLPEGHYGCGAPPWIYERCKAKVNNMCPAPCQCAQKIALLESVATSRAPSPAISEKEIPSFPPDFDTEMLEPEKGAQGHH